MKYEEIAALLDKGLTPDQIIELSNAAPVDAAAPAAPADPAPATDQQPQQVNDTHTPADAGPSNNDLLDAIQNLAKTMQTMAIYNITQPQQQEPTKTADDIMRELAFPLSMQNKKG